MVSCAAKRLASAALALAPLAVLLPAPSAAETRETLDRPTQEEPAGEAAEAPAPPAPRHSFRLSLADLGLTEQALAYADRRAQTVYFRARADHVLTQAELELVLAAPSSLEDFAALEVWLNDEPVAAIEAAELSKTPRSKIVKLDASLLAAQNALSLRLRTKGSESECARVESGTWTALRSGTLTLTSSALPLADELGQLPLPFFDPEFDREQTLRFVFPEDISSEGLRAASLLASWFALRGEGRLSFETHVGELPAADVVALLDSPKAAQALGLTSGTGADELASLSLRDNPRAPGRKVLIVQGSTPAHLLTAAWGLLRDGYALSGERAQYAEPVAPPTAPKAGEVPRWVTGPVVRLGSLPEPQPLRLEGGHTESLSLWFRLPPDLFLWPQHEIDLDIGYAQGIAPHLGPARVHLALNGYSLGTLPESTQGRLRLAVPRSHLRGYNEILVQASYPTSQGADAQTCLEQGDDAAWVGLTPDSTLYLTPRASPLAEERAPPRRFALWPDLGLFLYDGYPFASRADLSETVVLLPPAPAAEEISTMLGLFAHFTAVTGSVPTGARIVRGAVPDSTLAGHDVLLIAAAGRHPLFRQYAQDLPLSLTEGAIRAQRPRTSTWLARLLTGRFFDSELERAEARLAGNQPVGALAGLAAPWDPRRAWVIATASSPAHMPTITTLQKNAHGTEPINDLLVVSEGSRDLFRLGVERGRGELEPLMEARFSLAQHWPLLLLAVSLAAVLLAFFARGRLSALEKRRLLEAER